MSAQLILVRHGKSLWNAQNRFTGWVDVPLDATGWQEAEKAGKLLADFSFDAAFSSHLQRAITTLQVILRENHSPKSPIFLPAPNTVPRQKYAPRDHEFPVILHEVALAERHYGDLQGKVKSEILAEVGEEQFLKWRRGYDTPPPNGESLKDTFDRAVPYFCAEILPLLDQGKTVLISAHGNSLRALTKYLENISDKDIVDLEIPTGTPIIYDISVKNGVAEILKKEVLELEMEKKK